MSNDIILNIKTNTDQAKKSLQSLKGSFDILKVAAAGFIAAVGARQIASIVGDAISAASKQEDAINKLNVALRLAGEFSAEASEDMQTFASNLQSVTKIGDETTLEMLALAKSFGLSNDQAKDLVTAAADLSAVTGMSLDSAVRNLGKSFSGLAGELGESVPGMRDLTQEQLRAGAAIDLIIQKYGGAAQGEVKTFSGAIQQLQNTFGDLQEELGFIITQNPAVITAINFLSGAFSDMGSAVKDGRSELTKYISLTIEGLVASTSLFLSTVSGAIQGVANFVQNIRALRIQVKLLFESFLETVAVSSGMRKELDRQRKEISELIKEYDEAEESWNGLIGGIDQFGVKAEELRLTLSKLDHQQKISNRTTSEAARQAKELTRSTTESAKAAEEHRKSLEQFVSQARTSLANAGLSAAQVIEKSLAETTAKIQEAMQAGIITVSEGSKLLVAATLDAETKMTKIVEDEQAKREAAYKETFNRVKEANAKALEEMAKKERKFNSTIGGVLADVAQGEGGAKSMIASGIGAAADAALPGAGFAAQQLANSFMGGPEQVRAMVDAFAEALPELIVKIAESMPVFVDAIADNIGPIVIALVKAMPRIAWSLVEAVINLIRSPLQNLFKELFGGETIQRFGRGLVSGVNKAFNKIVEKVGELGQELWDEFIGVGRDLAKIGSDIFEGFIKRVGEIGQAIIDAIKEGVSGLFGGGGKDKDNWFEKGREEVESWFGMSTGGTVPRGFPNDNFPAALTSGEMVVPVDDVNRLRRFLDSQERGQQSSARSQPTVIQLVVGQKELAQVILDLNRSGFRTA